MACRLEIDGKETAAVPGSSIFDAAETIGVHVPTSCVKQGKCRECMVEIEAGAECLTPRSPEEEHLPPSFRLSCRARFAEEGLVSCHTMRRGTLRIEEEATGLDSPAVADRDPRYRRRGTQLLRGAEIIGETIGPIHGLAIDVGTTTVVLRLENLESGRPVATQSFENPQRFGGSDVMARIRYDTDHRGRLLQRVLFGYLRRAIESLPCDPQLIVDVMVVGNTTMRDLFFGLDVYSIGQLPYRSITEHERRDGRRTTTSLEVPASKLRLPLHAQATVTSLPLVADHVGSDAAACLLATGLAKRDSVSMCMDIGTNTELFIGNRERILAASCPAGPAFEGGGVLCGVPALDGAIERVVIGDDGTVATRVIGDRPPIGICGSGLVDLLGELLRTGRINQVGRYTDDESRFLVDRDHDIVLTEGDIDELAQAKGANAAGLHIVADRYGIELSQVEHFYVAGGFGRHLDVAAARRIGLVPDLPEARIHQVGNAALAGAVHALHSMVARRKLDEIVGRIEHVELETHPGFFDYFIDGCQFAAMAGSEVK